VFIGTEYKKKVLKPTAVPSYFEWTGKPSELEVTRVRRRLKRAELTCQEPSFDFDVVEEVVSATEMQTYDDVTYFGTQQATAATQTPVSSLLSISSLMDNDSMLHYYTGLSNYQNFVYVLSTLGTAANHLTYYKDTVVIMSIENQFLLTLMKLRRCTSNAELSFLFNVSLNVVSAVFVTWINFMSRQWRRINIWPERHVNRFFMPEAFVKSFPSTRVIIDGVEIPIKNRKTQLRNKQRILTTRTETL
jgi:hypothetical protein